MKNLKTMALAAVFVVLGAGCADVSTTSPALGKPYKDAELNFTISPPKDWTVEPQDSGKIQVTFKNTALAKVHNTLPFTANITVIAGGGHKDLAEDAKQLQQSQIDSTLFTGATFSEGVRGKISDRNTYSFTGSYNVKDYGLILEVVKIVAISENQAYLIMGTASEADWKVLEGVMTASVASFTP
jgi:hypothetical protein